MLQISDPRLAATAVQVQGGKIVCRLYSLHQGPAPVQVESKSLENPFHLKALTGESITEIRPYQIVHLEWWFYPHWRKEFDTSDPRYAGLYGEAHDLEGKVGNNDSSK